VSAPCFLRRRSDAGWVKGRLAACRYCGAPLPKGRRTFCSGEKARFPRVQGELRRVGGSGCVHEFCIRSNPGYARKLVEVRDRRKCAGCGVAASRDGWQADHIVPVVEGGGACGLENLRTLCRACHQVETKALAARRAAMRRGSAAAKSGDRP